MDAPRRIPVGVYAVALLATAVIVLPLFGLLHRAPWSSLWSNLTSADTVRALRLSLWTASLATIGSVLLGTPLAWVLARSAGRGIRTVRALVLLPMVLPPVIGGIALLTAFSLSSPTGRWLYDVFGVQLTFSSAGVVLAQMFVGMPFYVITVEGALRGLDRSYEEAALQLGASPLTTFRRVVAPLIAPSIAAGAVLTWARALGEFGATLTFAGNISGRTRTLPLEAYLNLETSRDSAVAVSLLLVVISLVALVAMRDRWLVRT